MVPNENNFTIPLSQAKEWTANWRKNNPNLSKAFLLPVEDLIGCLMEMGIITTDSKGNTTIKFKEEDKVRTYLGIDKDGEEKLIMVGTKNEGGTYTDIIREETAVEKSGGNSGIYNYSKPCPPECDPKSPLN